MKMICAQAKTTAKRDKAIEALLFEKYPELKPVTFALGQYSYVEWTEEDDQTIIHIEAQDESKVERLASEMKACGCVVKVMTAEELEVRRQGD